MSENDRAIVLTRPPGFPRDAVLLALCLIGAFALRLAIILAQRDQLFVDRDAYLGIAQSVADGRGYSSPGTTIPTAFRPPLYPLSLALGFKLFSPAFVVAAINLIAGVVTVWLVVQIGQKLELGWLGFLAAGIVAVDPLLVQYSSRAMTESFCTLLAALWMWSVVCLKSDSKWRAVGCGVAFGLLALSRPTFWLVPGFCAVWWAFQYVTSSDRLLQRERIREAFFASLGTVVTVGPWVIRNMLVMGAPILTTTHGGYTLLLANNPVFYEQVVQKPWGTIWPDDSQKAWESDLQSKIESAVGKDASELQRDRWQSTEAKNYISGHLRETSQAVLHRIHSLWSSTPQGDAGSGVNSAVIGVVRWYYLFVLTSAFVGMGLVLTSSQRGRWIPLFILVVSIQAVHLMYWTNARMRAPLTPAIGLFAAAAVRRLRG